MNHFELEKNILLTRYPLVFYPGKKTLFFHKKYWQILPEYLAEHGNDVFHLHLPWHSSKKRIQVFRQLMQEYSGKYHLIVDDIGFIELSLIDKEKYKYIASVLWIRSKQHTSIDQITTPKKIHLREMQMPIHQIEFNHKNRISFKEKIQFYFHRFFYPNTISPEFCNHLENAKMLLKTAEKCAEQDLHDSTTYDVISL